MITLQLKDPWVFYLKRREFLTNGHLLYTPSGHSNIHGTFQECSDLKVAGMFSIGA